MTDTAPEPAPRVITVPPPLQSRLARRKRQRRRRQMGVVDGPQGKIDRQLAVEAKAVAAREAKEAAKAKRQPVNEYERHE